MIKNNHNNNEKYPTNVIKNRQTPPILNPENQHNPSVPSHGAIIVIITVESEVSLTESVSGLFVR